MEEQGVEEAGEEEIDERIETMSTDEMISGVAVGFRLMAEHPDYAELDEAEFESADMFEEIHEYLRDLESDPDGEDH